MMGYDLTDEYRRFIMPTAAELEREEYMESLSATEFELVMLREDYINGEITREKFEFCAECALYQNPKETEDELDRLKDKYVGKFSWEIQ